MQVVNFLKSYKLRRRLSKVKKLLKQLQMAVYDANLLAVAAGNTQKAG
jgi:hypothetical protein